MWRIEGISIGKFCLFFLPLTFASSIEIKLYSLAVTKKNLLCTARVQYELAACGIAFLAFEPNDYFKILTYLLLSSYHLPGDSSSSEESSEEEEVKPKPPPAKKKKDTDSKDYKKTGTSDTELKVRRLCHVICCSREQ